MQDVNNDMDDLFRRAAEQYPLKTGGADWEKVLAGLGNEDTPAAPLAIINDNKEKRKKRMLWLLLLLPLMLLYAVWYNGSSPANKQVADNKESGQEKTVNNENENTNHNEVTIAKPPLQTIKQESGNNSQTENKKADNRVAKKANNIVKSNDKHTTYSFSNTGDQSTQKHKDNLSVFPPTTNYQPSTNTVNKTANAEIYDKGIDKNLMADDKKNINTRQPDESDNRIQNTITDSGKKEETKEVMVKQNSTDSGALLIKKQDSVVAKNEAANDKKVANKKAKTKQQQGFYAGLLGSFDVSTVKLQKVNKTGYGLHVLAGYQFSKRLSVETGISLSKKNYYSDGKYFDKGKTGIPDRVKIYFTNGNCNMLEVPVNVKYNFALHKKSNLFIMAGLSSYIMKKESYWYRGNYNMMREYDTTRSYRNSGSNLFSVAGFSLGYQLYLNKNSALRIEPYLQLPLHGIGIANMPIMSTGVSVGFTRKF